MTDTSGLVRLDDLNWGRLSLIRASDISDGVTHWEVEFTDADRVVIVSCKALPEFGAPYGPDNDVSAALIDLYIEQGLPENGLVIVPAAELLDRAGFHNNGHYWSLLKESIDRLHTSNFEVKGGWRDHPNQQWTTVKFHFVENLKYTHQGRSGVFDQRSVLRVRLADELVTSLRSGYTKPLDIMFMQSLKRPRTRILFRLLDAMRHDPEHPDQRTDQLDVGLSQWADHCKIPSGRPDAVRRALEGPHEELVKRGYLRSVRYEGRGKAQRVVYEFNPAFVAVDSRLLNRFRRHGVVDGVMRELIRDFPPRELHGRIDQFERLRDGGMKIRKTAAAALVHLIRHPEVYADVEAERHGA